MRRHDAPLQYFCVLTVSDSSILTFSALSVNTFIDRATHISKISQVYTYRMRILTFRHHLKRPNKLDAPFWVPVKSNSK